MKLETLLRLLRNLGFDREDWVGTGFARQATFRPLYGYSFEYLDVNWISIYDVDGFSVDLGTHPHLNIEFDEDERGFARHVANILVEDVRDVSVSMDKEVLPQDYIRKATCSGCKRPIHLSLAHVKPYEIKVPVSPGESNTLHFCNQVYRIRYGKKHHKWNLQQ